MTETSNLWEELIQPGDAWSHVLKRGTAMRLTDLEGAANVGAIFLQFRMPCRALQHAGYAQGAAHCSPHERLRSLLRYGTNPCIGNCRLRGLARSPRRHIKPPTDRKKVRSCNLPGSPQRVLQKWP